MPSKFIIQVLLLSVTMLTSCGDRPTSAEKAPEVNSAATTLAASSPTLRKPIGITTAGDVFSPLVPAGQRLPYTHSETFSNATNGKAEVMVELSQKDSTGTETITSLRIPIPHAANKSLDITVTLIISADKNMRVKTTVAQTGKVQEFGPFPVT